MIKPVVLTKYFRESIFVVINPIMAMAVSKRLLKTFLKFGILVCMAMPILGFADELTDRASIKKDVETQFWNGNFSQLEATADTFRNEQPRTSSGLWKLTLFYSGLSLALNTDERDKAYWAIAKKQADKWVKLYPKSATAHIAYAMMLSNHGWSFRGGGYADTVKPQDWAPFKKYTEEARRYLETHKAIAASDPKWYENMLNIAKLQSWPEARFKVLLHEALDRHPNFYQIYFVAIDYYAPKWGGSAKSIEEFAREAASRTRNDEGYGMYARVYWYASQTQYGDRLFSDSLVDWTTMKVGIDDVLKKYPDSWNINNFAWFACLSGDPLKTSELIKRMAEPPLMEAWGSMDNYKACKSWALSKNRTTSNARTKRELMRPDSNFL